MGKTPARGHKVVEKHIRKEKTYDALSIQRDNGNGTKILGKSDTPQYKQKKKRKKRVWLSGCLHLEERLNEGPRLQ